MEWLVKKELIKLEKTEILPLTCQFHAIVRVRIVSLPLRMRVTWRFGLSAEQIRLTAARHWHRYLLCFRRALSGATDAYSVPTSFRED